MKSKGLYTVRLRTDHSSCLHTKRKVVPHHSHGCNTLDTAATTLPPSTTTTTSMHAAMSTSPALYTAKRCKHPTSNRQWAQTDVVWAPGNVSFNLLFFRLTNSFFFFLGSNIVTTRHHHDGPHIYPRHCELLLAGQHQRNAVEPNEQKWAQMMLVIVWVPAKFF